MPPMTHDWAFVSEPDEFGHSVPLPRGRLVGGCSATIAGVVCQKTVAQSFLMLTIVQPLLPARSSACSAPLV